MKDKTTTVQIALFMLAAGLLYLGDRFAWPVANSLAALCFGVLCLVMSVQMIVTGSAPFFISQNGGSGSGRFSNLPTQLWGVVLLFFGAFLFLSAWAIAFLPGGPGALWGRVLETQWGRASLLTGLGALALVSGIVRMLAGSNMPKTGFSTRLTDLSERGIGCFYLFVGLGLLAVGLGVAWAPVALHALAMQGLAFLMHLLTR
jgi:hypothetical protein